MYKPVQSCTNCGAGLTLDDMRRDDCPYCEVIYPHKSQAAQHAQMANQMMGQMMAQANAWYGPQPGAGPPGPPGGGPPGGPPPVGPPPGMGPPGMGQPGMGPPGMPPHYNPNAMIQHHMNQVHQTQRGIQKMVMWITIGSFVFIGLIVALTMFL